jgi:hypothetical protein
MDVRFVWFPIRLCQVFLTWAAGRPGFHWSLLLHIEGKKTGLGGRFSGDEKFM